MTGRELLQLWKNLEELAIGGFGLCFHGGDAFGDHAGDVVAASRRGSRGARALFRFFKIHSDRGAGRQKASFVQLVLTSLGLLYETKEVHGSRTLSLHEKWYLGFMILLMKNYEALSFSTPNL